MQFITRPLQTWPRPQTKQRRRSPYSLDYTRTLAHLESELEKLGASGDIVLQIDIAEGTELRRDGTPYSDERVRSPRVGISFSSRHGPLVYFCDRFHEWQGNVRAIGLGLERLRLVEETGITSRGEQYTGFRALPPGIPLGPAAMTIDEAARVIVERAPTFTWSSGKKVGAGDIIEKKELFKQLSNAAVKEHHPDRGGTREDWDSLQTAVGILEKHFGGG